MKSIFPFVILTALPAVAQDLPATISCSGIDPAWDLRITADETLFTYQYETDLRIGLVTTSEGGDWPRAYSLAGREGTAVAIINPLTDGAICEGGQYSNETVEGMVLTQRGETPVMLQGCCSISDD